MRGSWKRFLVYGLTILVVLIFLGIMSSGPYIKSYHSSAKEIDSILTQIQESVNAKSWQKAEKELSSLDKAWADLAPIIQISSEEDDVKQFSQVIKHLKGYLKAKDTASSFGEMELLKLIWERLGTGR